MTPTNRTQSSKTTYDSYNEYLLHSVFKFSSCWFPTEVECGRRVSSRKTLIAAGNAQRGVGYAESAPRDTKYNALVVDTKASDIIDIN